MYIFCVYISDEGLVSRIENFYNLIIKISNLIKMDKRLKSTLHKRRYIQTTTKHMKSFSSSLLIRESQNIHYNEIPLLIHYNGSNERIFKN